MIRSGSFSGAKESTAAGEGFPAPMDLDDDLFPAIFAEKLTSLNLSSNNLQKIPSQISNLVQLSDLDISK